MQNIKQLYIFSIIIAFYLNSYANPIPYPCKTSKTFKLDCDICSCSTSSGSFGNGTLNNSNFIGLRYIYQDFETKNGIFNNSPTSKESFSTYQLWAQVPISKKLLITTVIPYHYLSRSINNTHINGIGDANLIMWYKLKLYKKQNKDALYFAGNRQESRHSLQFGLGIKLPTGEFEQEFTGNINPGFQLGTGSVDAILSIGHTYTGNKLGVNTSINYYLKGTNKNQYKFGDQTSINSNIYTTLVNKTKFKITPYIGLSADIYQPIKQYNQTIRDTDGYIINNNIGTELSANKFIFGASYTIPITQELFANNVKALKRLSLYINYTI